jgi:hypothetical protein
MDYGPSSVGFVPTPCLSAGSAGRQAGGSLGSQKQALTKDTKSTVETTALRSEIEEKRKTNNKTNNVVVEMVVRAKRGSLWPRLQFCSSSPRSGT